MIPKEALMVVFSLSITSFATIEFYYRISQALVFNLCYFFELQEIKFPPKKT